MVIWAEAAKADLRAIYDRIAHDSTYYAKKVVQELAAKLDLLDGLPRLGKMLPELGNDAVRELS